MAIILDEFGAVEVRVKSDLDQAYLKEYYAREDQDDTAPGGCERIFRPQGAYTLEVKVKEGYEFGDCQSLRVSFHLAEKSGPGLDITCLGTFAAASQDCDCPVYFARIYAPGSGTTVLSQEILVAQFIRDLISKDFKGFRVDIAREYYDRSQADKGMLWEDMTEQEIKISISSPTQEKKFFAIVPDDDERKNCAEAYHVTAGASPADGNTTYWHSNYKRDSPLRVHFWLGNGSIEEVLVPRALPLHTTPWEDLDYNERIIALIELQNLIKNDLSGFYKNDPSKSKYQKLPPELCSWTLMEVWEQHEAFKLLQTKYRTYQLENGSGGVYRSLQIFENSTDNISEAIKLETEQRPKEGGTLSSTILLDLGDLSDDSQNVEDDGHAHTHIQHEVGAEEQSLEQMSEANTNISKAGIKSENTGTATATITDTPKNYNAMAKPFGLPFRAEESATAAPSNSTIVSKNVSLPRRLNALANPFESGQAFAIKSEHNTGSGDKLWSTRASSDFPQGFNTPTRKPFVPPTTIIKERRELGEGSESKFNALAKPFTPGNNFA